MIIGLMIAWMILGTVALEWVDRVAARVSFLVLTVCIPFGDLTVIGVMVAVTFTSLFTPPILGDK